MLYRIYSKSFHISAAIFVNYLLNVIIIVTNWIRYLYGVATDLHFIGSSNGFRIYWRLSQKDVTFIDFCLKSKIPRNNVAYKCVEMHLNFHTQPYLFYVICTLVYSIVVLQKSTLTLYNYVSVFTCRHCYNADKQHCIKRKNRNVESPYFIIFKLLFLLLIPYVSINI